MMNDIENAYQAWHKKESILSVGQFDSPEWKKFIDTCRNNISETIDFFIAKMQKEEISGAIYALDVLFPGVISYVGYCPLEIVSKHWLTVLLTVDRNELIEIAKRAIENSKNKEG